MESQLTCKIFSPITASKSQAKVAANSRTSCTMGGGGGGLSHSALINTLVI